MVDEPFTLPWPPSMNSNWRNVGNRTLLSADARKFRATVCRMFNAGGPRKPPAGGRIALAMDAYPPDRRRRDLDNIQKPTLDALQHAGVYEDDSQIDLLITRRCDVRPGGKLDIYLYGMPLTHCPCCGARVDAERN